MILIFFRILGNNSSLNLFHSLIYRYYQPRINNVFTFFENELFDNASSGILSAVIQSCNASCNHMNIVKGEIQTNFMRHLISITDKRIL